MACHSRTELSRSSQAVESRAREPPLPPDVQSILIIASSPASCLFRSACRKLDTTAHLHPPAGRNNRNTFFFFFFSAVWHVWFIPEQDQVVLHYCNHSLFVLVIDCTNVWRAKITKWKKATTHHAKMIYKGRSCSRGRARNIKCHPVQFYFRWLAQIGGEISASNQLALAVSLSFCFLNVVLVSMKEVSVKNRSPWEQCCWSWRWVPHGFRSGDHGAVVFAFSL